MVNADEKPPFETEFIIRKHSASYIQSFYTITENGLQVNE